MLPRQFVEEFESLSPQRPSCEVTTRVVELDDFGFPHERKFKATNIVIGPTGIEIVCEPV
jgi:hypothetical protein